MVVTWWIVAFLRNQVKTINDTLSVLYYDSLAYKAILSTHFAECKTYY